MASEQEDNKTTTIYPQVDKTKLSQEEIDYQEFLEFKKHKRKNEGFTHELGDSINQRTAESFEKLRLDIPDGAYLASRRPNENLKRSIEQIKGQPPKVTKVIRQIYRLRNKRDNKEYLVYNEQQYFKDLNGNLKNLIYDSVGTHQEAYGQAVRDINYNLIDSELQGYRLLFDIPFSKKELERIMKEHGGDLVNEIDDYGPPELIVGYTNNITGAKSVYSTADKIYTISNLDDFKSGTHEQLIELGQRALSSTTPSLGRLKQPIAEDPNSSVIKQQRFPPYSSSLPSISTPSSYNNNG